MLNRHPKTSAYLAQTQQLAFAPSLGALRVAYLSQKQAKRNQQPLHNLLSVAYPGSPPLPNVIPEAQAVTNYATQGTLLQEQNATPQRVIERARDKQALHLGCHGIFDPKHEEESGLMLAGGWLTVQRIKPTTNAANIAKTTSKNGSNKQPTAFTTPPAACFRLARPYPLTTTNYNSLPMITTASTQLSLI